MDKRLMGETRQVRGAFTISIILSLIVGVLVIGQAFVLSRIINRVFLHNATLSDVANWLLLFAIIIVARALFNAGQTIAAAQVAIQVKDALRQHFISHIIQLGPAFTQNENSGELTLAATEGIEALDAFFRDYLPALFIAVLIPLAILISVIPIDVWTFFVLVLTGPLIPIFMVLIGMAAGALAKQQYGIMSHMSAHFLDVMQGLPTLKLFNRSKNQIETIQRITNQFREATMQVLRLAFLSSFVLELVAMISIAVVAVEIGLRLLHGNIGFEQALFLLVIAPEFYSPLRQLGMKFHAGRDGTAAADRIYAVLNTVATQTPGTDSPPSRMNIQFKDVHLTYGDRTALQGINLTINAGETVALVGESGAGKTTIANLLLRFVEPTQGKILIDHLDLQSIDSKAWREQIAWIPQSPYLFNQSVADNIRLGKPDASDEEVMASAQAAQAHDFIMALEDGYDTIIGERGTRLSGGQAQRIAIARAFLRDAPLIIMDEATAHLDHDTESKITQVIATLIQDRTVIIIAHRLNTIVQADRIYVLDDGTVAEYGTHTQLIAQTGLYQQLVDVYGVASA